MMMRFATFAVVLFPFCHLPLSAVFGWRGRVGAAGRPGRAARGWRLVARPGRCKGFRRAGPRPALRPGPESDNRQLLIRQLASVCMKNDGHFIHIVGPAFERVAGRSAVWNRGAA